MKINTSGIALIASSLVLVLAGCGTGGGNANPTPQIKNKDYFIVASITDVNTLDPAFAYDVGSVGQIQNIYETLIKFSESSTSEFTAGLATEWNISEDGLTYRFKIREGVKFHNGNTLTPEDVEYSFERGMVYDYSQGPEWMFFEPLFGLGVYSSRTENGLIPLEDIKSGVEADGQWVQFNLAVPYEPFLQILASSWGSIVDKDWCIENGDWTGTDESYLKLNNPPPGGSPIHSIANGTGPFELEFWEPAIQISLNRNDDYWGEPANFTKVVTKIVDEWSLRKLMFEEGDVDCAIVPPASIPEITSAAGITAYENAPTLQNTALFFQFDIAPGTNMVGTGKLDGHGIPLDFFTDVNVRKGFAYAFDWDAFINEALGGYGLKIASPIVQGIPFYNPNLPMYEMDLAKSEEYLKQAWGGEVWDKGFEVTVVYSVGDMAAKTACEILQTNLFAVNPLFKINIQLMTWPNVLDNMVLGQLPLFVNGWTADYPDPHNFVFPYMNSKGTFAQWQGYSNPQVDALIEQALEATDSAQRQQLYNQIAQLYYDDVPSIMLSQGLGVFFFRDWIEGFHYNPIRPVYEMYAYYLNKGYPE